MITIDLDLDDRSYPIFIGQTLLGNSELLTPFIKGSRVFIVTNTTVDPLYSQKVLDSLSSYNASAVVLPDGEEYKTLDTVNSIFTALLEEAADRQTTLVALGGGVVGDITGFAAACYQRGIPFIQIPTTLLAQVDSSVGGKTGVNHTLGKNMIGAFYQPQAVIIDTDTLTTLDDRQFRAGIAEVIKYGLVFDAEFFSWLESNIDALLAQNVEALSYAIDISCRRKADIVALDEKESGARALLNLGHTFGHAIETSMGYGNWLHGEAVAAGMCMAARFSHSLGRLNNEQVLATENLIKRFGLPTHSANIPTAEFIKLMTRDKKTRDGVINLILLDDVGVGVVTSKFKLDDLINFLDNEPKIDQLLVG